MSATTATLSGIVNAAGAPVSWQFQYGQIPYYDKDTPLQTIATGHGQMPVSWKLIRLMPNTTYRFGLVVSTVSGGQTIVTRGHALTFTTSPTGKLTLLGRRFKVKHGAAVLRLKCSSKLKCSGRFSVTTGATGGRFKNLSTVLCTTKLFSIPADKTRTISSRLKRSCLALLRHSRRRQIQAKFTSGFKTGQLGVTEKITLVLQ